MVAQRQSLPCSLIQPMCSVERYRELDDFHVCMLVKYCCCRWRTSLGFLHRSSSSLSDRRCCSLEHHWPRLVYTLELNCLLLAATSPMSRNRMLRLHHNSHRMFVSVLSSRWCQSCMPSAPLAHPPGLVPQPTAHLAQRFVHPSDYNQGLTICLV